MNDLGAITWWLAILTVLVGVQVVTLAVLAIRATQLFKRAETTLDSAERALQPVVSETRELLADLRAVRRATEHVKTVVTRKFWPVFGAIAAGRAIAGKVAARRTAQKTREKREDAIATARFVSEGGVHGGPADHIGGPIHDTR